jgi:hypothetical protein
MTSTPDTKTIAADPAGDVALVDASSVLAAAKNHRAIENAAAVEQFRLATEWALLHPATDLGDAAVVEGTGGELAIAGQGAPLVAEFCVAELAAVLGLSTDAGSRYLGEAVETRFRLPRLWAQVLAGQVAVWKARKIAHHTLSLPIQGAAFVDQHLAPVADRCSFAQIERTVAEALVRYDPDQAEQKRREAAERRHFDLDTHRVSFDGTVEVRGELDLADALDLNDALTTGAQALADLGCEESLDVRRAMAAGELARHQPVLDLTTTSPEDPDDPDGPAPRRTRRRPRSLVIYAHLADDAFLMSRIVGLYTRSSKAFA